MALRDNECNTNAVQQSAHTKAEDSSTFASACASGWDAQRQNLSSMLQPVSDFPQPVWSSDGDEEGAWEDWEKGSTWYNDYDERSWQNEEEPEEFGGGVYVGRTNWKSSPPGVFKQAWNQGWVAPSSQKFSSHNSHKDRMYGASSSESWREKGSGKKGGGNSGK